MRIHSSEALHLGEETFMNLGILPPGKYTHHFTIINPFADYFELLVERSNEAGVSFLVKDKSAKKNINIPFKAYGDKEIIFQFHLKTGHSISIKPAISPQLHSAMQGTLPRSLMISDLANSFFVHEETKRQALSEDYRPVDVYARVFKEVQARNEKDSGNHISGAPDFFYELIDLNTSKKQLDYVVFEKFLAARKGNMFRRARRKLARKLFVFAYKVLTRDENRKNYLAKLYRNYINMNYLSERRSK